MILIDLIYNLTLLIALSVVSGFVGAHWQRGTRLGALLQGVVFGGAAVIGMLRPFVFAPGLIFDGRSVMISLGALFFGPWAAAVACLMTIPFRLVLGGPGTGMGVLVILVSAAIGMGFHRRLPTKPNEVSAAMLLGFGVVVHLAMLGMTITLPPETIVPVLQRIGLPVMLTYPLATVLIGRILSDQTARGGLLDSMRESETRYRLISENSSDVVWLFDLAANRFTYVSPSVEKLRGFTVPEALRQTLQEALTPESYHRVAELLPQRLAAFAAGDDSVRTERLEVIQPRKDGSTVPTEVVTTMIVGDGRRVTHLQGVTRDITERKRVEARLRESEEHFRLLYQKSPVGYQSLDANGCFLEVNETWLEIMGYTREEVVGRWFGNLLAPGGAEDFRQQFSRFKAAGEVNRVEFDMERKDRTAITVAFQGRVAYDDEGQFKQMHCVLRDITEIKQAEAALQALARDWQTTFNAVKDAIWLLDEENRILRSNNATLEVLKKDPREIVGRHCWEVLHGTTEPIATCPYRRMKESKRRETIEMAVGDRWFRVAVDPILDERGAVRGTVHILSDITGHKQLEAQFLQAQKLEAVGQLAGGVAHDFNNILAALMLNLHLLRENPNLDQETAESLKELDTEAQRAAHLTRQLLLFSRRQAMEIRPVDIRGILEGLMKMLGRLLGEHIAIEILAGKEALWVKADAGMLEQVVTNLCVNARDAMPKGGRLKLDMQRVEIDREQARRRHDARVGRFVCLSVSDTGCGIDSATLDRIFEPFFTTKEIGQGTGLGLATVYGIVKQHQGWVEVESVVGIGTTFRVYWPATEKPEPVAASPDSGKAPGGTETILLAEDDQSLRQILRTMLRRYGYRVLEAQNGLEAVQVWERQGGQIDLLFTDMVMPEGMTGLELAKRLRQLKPKLKVVVSSGYSVDFMTRNAVEQGAMRFLAKPVQSDILARTVRSCLDSKT